MADVVKLTPQTAARVAAESATLDAGSLLKSAKGAILPCEHNAYVLLAAAPQYAGLHFDEFLSRLRIVLRPYRGKGRQ